MVSIIAAMSKNRVIGIKNALPWHLPADLAHFKKLTEGNAVIMGDKTYESIGKLLPNRKNIILSLDPDYRVDGALMVHSYEEALEKAGENAWIIGGGQVYRQGLEYADKVHLTLVDAEIKGDTYFPKFEKDGWQLVSREDHRKDQKNQYDYSFLVYEKKK